MNYYHYRTTYRSRSAHWSFTEILWSLPYLFKCCIYLRKHKPRIPGRLLVLCRVKLLVTACKHKGSSTHWPNLQCCWHENSLRMWWVFSENSKYMSLYKSPCSQWSDAAWWRYQCHEKNPLLLPINVVCCCNCEKHQSQLWRAGNTFHTKLLTNSICQVTGDLQKSVIYNAYSQVEKHIYYAPRTCISIDLQTYVEW